MRWRISVMIGSAMGCGMLASMLVANWTAARPAETAKEETTRIYVALRDLRDGEAINERNVALTHWPKRGLPPGAVEQIDDVKLRRIDGRIAAGQPIQLSRLKSNVETNATAAPVENSATNALVPPVAERTIPESPAPRQIAIELDGHGPGPWLVSTGDKLHVTPLEEACRQAFESAQRSAAAAATNSTPAPSLASPAEAPPETLGEPIATVSPDDRLVSPRTPLQVEEIPWSSSVVTPEGAKILRWRDPAELAPSAAKPRSIKSTSSTAGVTSAPFAASPLSGRFCELSGTTLAGREFDWNAYRGRPVLVVVHLARSSASREELALVTRVAEAYRHRGLAVVGVGLDEELETVRALARNNQIAWPVVVGPGVRQWARAAGLDQPLSLLVLDEAGRVANVGHRVGDVTPAIALACDDADDESLNVRQARRPGATTP